MSYAELKQFYQRGLTEFAGELINGVMARRLARDFNTAYKYWWQSDVYEFYGRQ